MRLVIDSSVIVAALASPNPESASRVVLAAVAAGAAEPVITHADLPARPRDVPCEQCLRLTRRYPAGYVESCSRSASTQKRGVVWILHVCRKQDQDAGIDAARARMKKL